MNANKHSLSKQPTETASKQPPGAESPDQLTTVLAELETCLEQPIVPGELSPWANAVSSAYVDAEGPLQEAFETTHPALFDQIRREDEDLYRQVEQMKEEDAKLRTEYATLSRDARRLRVRSDQEDSDESVLSSEVEQSIEKGLAFVIRIRKQQSAINTWLLEAFQRDTGVAD